MDTPADLLKIDQFIFRRQIVGLVWNFECGMYCGWYLIGASLKIIPDSFQSLSQVGEINGIMPSCSCTGFSNSDTSKNRVLTVTRFPSTE